VGDGPPKRRGLLALALLAVVGIVVALVWPGGAPNGGGGETPALPGPKVPLGGSPSVAEVEGRLFLEGSVPADQPLGDPTLVPATDCVVRVWAAGAQVAAPVRCGADGRFVASLNAGTSGRVSVELEAPGRLRAVVTVDLPEDGRGVLPDVAVGVGQTVRGQVVDLRGAAVGGVVVEARPIPDLGESEPWRRMTADDGTFAIDTLPPGPVALRCAPEGFAPTVVEAIAPQDDVLLRLGGLYDVRGTVLAAGTDAEVGGANVRLQGSGVWPARVVEVEPDGAFSVPSVPDGIYALEAVVGDDPQEPAFASLPLEGVEPDLEVTLALVPAHWVPVLVEDPDGTPVAGARVTLMNAQVGMLGRSATTGEDGTAWLGPVVPGPYVARADGDGLLASPPASVQVEDGAPEQVVLRLERPGRLVVSVVDPAGAAVPGAQIRLRTDAIYSVGEAQTRAATFARTVEAGGTLGVMTGPVPPVPLGDDEETAAWRRTSGSGVAAFEGLVPGAYSVVATHPDYATSAERTATVKAGGRAEVTLVLREGQPLTGRVRDGNDRPVEGAQIRVNDLLLARTDGRGVFDAGPHAGTVRVSVRATGYATQTKTVEIADAPVDLEWTLEDADGVLNGQVLGGNERPVEGARVTVHPRGGTSRTAWTDDKGAFAFQNLARGRAEVMVEHADYVPSSSPVTVDADASITVLLEEGWSTTIVVRWKGTLEPVVGARVRGGGLDATVGERGDAELSGLARETVRLEVSAAGAPSTRRSVRRSAAEGKTIFVELVEGGSLQGRVENYRGDPVPGARVEVRRPGEDEVLATTKASARGRYRFEGLPEGDVEVQAWPPRSAEDQLGTEVLTSDIRRGHVTQQVVFKLPRG
jgi:protocatechuate 3,4-dioxygenase beta subunit